jgi:hypothetical protein
MKHNELRSLIRQHISEILSEQSNLTYSDIIDKFQDMRLQVEDLHKDAGNAIRDNSEQDFVVFSRYINVLYKGIDNLNKFLAERQEMNNV